MSGEPRVFRISKDSKESVEENEVNFADHDIKETVDIQEWVATNPSILSDELLIIAKEYRGFDTVNERPDLIAIDRQGGLVVVELKRDDAGADTHWQAIKYASYLRKATSDDIVNMLGKYKDIDEEEAKLQIIKHIDNDDEDLSTVLNHYQRIILASHRFPSAVTSAALWINSISGRDVITCISLTPYDLGNKYLHIVTSTIVPVPGEENVSVGIGNRRIPANLPRANELKKRNQQDDITVFLDEVARRVKNEVDDGYKTIKTSRWAGGWEYHRYYHFWFGKQHPWSNWGTSFRIELNTELPYSEQLEGEWEVHVGFVASEQFEDVFEKSIHEEQYIADDGTGLWVSFESQLLDDKMRDKIIEVSVKFINTITPVINEILEER